MSAELHPSLPSSADVKVCFDLHSGTLYYVACKHFMLNSPLAPNSTKVALLTNSGHHFGATRLLVLVLICVYTILPQ